MDVSFHPWRLGFRQSSFYRIARVLHDDKSGMFARLMLFNHAVVP